MATETIYCIEAQVSLFLNKIFPKLLNYFRSDEDVTLFFSGRFSDDYLHSAGMMIESKDFSEELLCC